MSLLVDLIDLPLLGEGRISFALQGLSEATLAAPGVADRVAQARAASEKTAETRLAWARTKAASEARGKAVEIDAQIDRALGSLAAIPQSLMRSMPEGDPTHQAAREFLKLALPEGAGKVVNLSFEAELHFVQAMLVRIDAAGDLAARAGVAPVIAVLKVLVPQFEAELNTRPKLIEHSVLRAHDAQMQRALAAVIVQITAAHLDDDAALSAALGPILAQIDRVRMARKNKRKVRDVDPETGVEV